MSGQPNFLSYADVLRRHQELSQAGREVSASDLHDFAAAAAAAGARIAATRERSLVQNILYYWAAEQITRGGKTEAGWTPSALAPFNAAAVAKAAPPATGEAAAAAEPPAPAPALADSDVEGLARTRAIIRIAATARQWRVKDHEPGYLLTGRALAEASLYVEDDPDIAELVRASGRAASRDKRMLALLALVLIGALFYGWIYETQVSAKLGEQTIILSNQKNELLKASEALQKKTDDLQKSAHAADLEAEEAKIESKSFQEKTEAALKRSREQQVQLDDVRRQLDEAVKALRASRTSGKIAADDVPEPLRPLVEPQAAMPPERVPVLPSDPSLVNGYDSAFLTTANRKGEAAPPVEFPKLAPKFAGQAFGDGKRLDYVNFSIMLSAARRMPLASASNLDRSRTALLARIRSNFRFDERVPREAQADPVWFTNTSNEPANFDLGRLVTAREIAWGPAFTGDAAAAGQRAYALVNTLTNVAPQFNTFSRGVWYELEQYAKGQFNAGVSHVTVMSGPVLAEDDPIISGVKTPRQFWKILVSTAPDRPSDLVVEAYLMAQVNEAGTGQLEAAKFVPDKFRARLSDIERLTHLDFGAALRAADQLWRVTPQSVQKRDRTRGDDLAERASLIDDPDQQVRQRDAQ